MAGERLPGAEADTTQDFLLVSSPVFAADTAKTFARGLKLLALTTGRCEWAKAALSALPRPIARGPKQVFGFDLILLNGAGGYPLVNLPGERYYTQAPLRFGDYIAKLDIVPASANFQAADRPVGPAPRDPRGACPHPGRRGRLLDRQGAALPRSGGDPIEDASIVWPESVSPISPSRR